MDIAALDMDFCCRRVEVLILYLPHRATIDGVGVFRTEFRHIELTHAAPYFLVRGNAYLYFTMLELLMFNKILDSAHYCGDTSLVISAKESGAVGSDDGVTQIV